MSGDGPPALVKRSLTLAGHRTSVALEAEFWAVLEAMAAERGESLSALVAGVDAGRRDRPLASALRLAALSHTLAAPPWPADEGPSDD